MAGTDNKIYLAGRYDRRAELSVYAGWLRLAGWEVTSTWLWGENPATPRENALLDLRDVVRSYRVAFFEPPKHPCGHSHGGGRHVELGAAIALEKEVIVIGARETIFHNLGNRFFDTPAEFLGWADWYSTNNKSPTELTKCYQSLIQASEWLFKPERFETPK